MKAITSLFTAIVAFNLLIGNVGRASFRLRP